MSLTIQQPAAGPDVTRRNGRGALYITSDGVLADRVGDGDPNGSFRIIFDPDNDDIVIQKKTGGVYNPTQFRVAGNSLALGFNFLIQSAAHFIKTENSIGTDHHENALISHIPFSDAGSDFSHTPVLDVIKNVDIFISPAGEINNTVIGQQYLLLTSQILQRITYQVGSQGASSQVTHRIFQGTDNTGELIDEIIISSTSVNPNTPLVVELNSNVGTSVANVNVFIELSSANSFSLQTDSGGNVITSTLTQELKLLDNVMDELVLTEDLSIVFANGLNFVTHNRFN